jgi:CRP/FNR family transcriptional regulator, cyclic AMP receptor protein
LPRAVPAQRYAARVVVSDARSRPVGLMLDLDPDLGAGIAGEDWQAARAACRARLVRVGRKRWPFPEHAGERDDLFGAVIVQGLVAREVALDDRVMLELLGPRDVLQLPVTVNRPRLSEALRLTVLCETSLLVLDRSFIAAAGRWPCLLAAVLRRLEVQRERLAVHGAIAHLPRAEDRLLLTLWELAERWGSRTREGTIVDLPLTHDLLGHLIGGRRSTVTLAVSALQGRGLIRRLADGSWMLTVAAESAAEAITRLKRPSRVVGETLRLQELTRIATTQARTLRAEAQQA